jgi:hypothetical protein
MNEFKVRPVPEVIYTIAGLLARADFTEARSIAALFLARETLNLRSSP